MSSLLSDPSPSAHRLSRLARWLPRAARPLALGAAVAWSGGLASCSTTFTAAPCQHDDDCGSELICAGQGGGRRCDRPEQEVLRVGMSAPGSGPSVDLGVEMKRGVQLVFDEQNARGGVRGRPLVLDFRDDEYDAAFAEKNARSLLDVQSMGDQAPRCPSTMAPPAGGAPLSQVALGRGPGAVLAVLGNVGTPTMVRFAPLAVETGTLFFGAFTGATSLLRDDVAGACKRYVFNVRASYAQEAEATMQYFLSRGVDEAARVISFDQDDSFGDAGYQGLVDAYVRHAGALPAGAGLPRFRYTKGDAASVDKAAAGVTALLAARLAQPGVHRVGILMTDTYAPATAFIRAVRTWQYADPDRVERLQLTLSNVSFVGPNSLAAKLREAGTIPGSPGLPFSRDVIVSQVVPNYQSDPSDIVSNYRQALAATGAAPTFTSLEGYVAARVFVAGLLAHQGEYTPEALIPTFEALPPLGQGLGASSGFSPSVHDYSRTVWGTALTPDGGFSNLYYWSEGSPIRFFE